MAALLAAYGRALVKRPVLTNSVTACVLYGSGDCLAQQLEKYQNVQSSGKTSYNFERTARMCLFGLAVSGPILTHWYSYLPKMTSVFRYSYELLPAHKMFGTMYQQRPLASGARNEVLAKLVLDQLFFQAPFLNLYLFIMSMLEGHTFSEGIELCKKNFHDCWGIALLFWVPGQYANFTLAPAHLAPLVVSSLGLIWNAMLSLLFHHRDYAAEHAAELAASEQLALAAASPTLVAPTPEPTPAPTPTIIELSASVDSEWSQSLNPANAARTVCSYVAYGAEHVVDFANRAGHASAAAWAAFQGMEEEVASPAASPARKEGLNLGESPEIEALYRTVASQAVRLQLLSEQPTQDSVQGPIYVKSPSMGMEINGNDASPMKVDDSTKLLFRKIECLKSHNRQLEKERDDLRRVVTSLAMKLEKTEGAIPKVKTSQAGSDSPRELISRQQPNSNVSNSPEGRLEDINTSTFASARLAI
mmetsp:Transcript_73382/g.160704  ORF Transcript_73382/g.160704 Transcript_73382/m.160704 type:complete len:475 (-) Transcript_73382:240-1664(-)